MTADRRAALVEKANTAYFRAGTMATPEERMAATLDLIRAEVLEEAARVAEREGVYPELNIYNGGPEWYRHGKRIAAAIRALKEKQ